MFRHLRAWWTLLELGPARRVAKQVMEHFRYSILKTMENEGLFEYLKTPRSYGEILARFGYKDDGYVRELLDLMAHEKNNVLIVDNGRYAVNPRQPLPTLEDLLASTDSRNHDFVLISNSLAQNIPDRLRDKPVEYTAAFEEQSREMMQSFDKVLGNQLYSVSRSTALALLKREERQWLRGKSLLDIGCGAGRETAELWVYFGGEVRITAIDPVRKMLDRAEEQLPALLDEIDPDHPPLVNTNQPVFIEASVTHMPFEDNTFDAVFHSHVLHWSASPQRAIAEIVRVLKPGGLVLGVQTCKPYTAAYTDILWRANENFYGFFWKEEFIRWYREQGIPVEYVTPAGAFRGHLEKK